MGCGSTGALVEKKYYVIDENNVTVYLYRKHNRSHSQLDFLKLSTETMLCDATLRDKLKIKGGYFFTANWYTYVYEPISQLSD